MKALILTEGGKDIGFGHITRCIALYEAFQEKGISPEIIINGDETINDLLKDTRHRIFNWLEKEDKLSGHIKESDVVIIDSYLAALDMYGRISETVKIPVYIDDNKRLDFPKGVVVNGGIFAERLGYPKKIGVPHLLGAKYALLRKIFWSVPGKKINDDISSVMLTFGGNDKRNMAPKVLKMLSENYPHFIKNVVIGRGYSNTGQIRKAADRNTNIVFSPDSQKMADIAYESDIAITAAGQSLYELARIGLVAIAVAIADNQLNNAAGWREAGFIEYAGWWEDKDVLDNIIKAIGILNGKDERRKRSKVGMRKVSGDGALRVVNFLSDRMHNVQHGILLRKASMHDCENLWLWRNHPEVLKNCFNSENVARKDHDNWLHAKIKNAGTRMYIALMGKNKIGVIRFDIKEDHIGVNVNLNPEFFNRGFGHEIIKLGTEKILSEIKETKPIIAEIKNGNIVSQKVFFKAGYKCVRTTGDRSIYVKEPIRAQSV